MSEPAWWGREAGGRGRVRTTTGPGPSGVQPELVDASQALAREAVRARIAGYTPDWTNPDRQDAGVALIRLFGTQLQPVLARVNRLPEKLLVEQLRLAGVAGVPATAAHAVLQFAVRPPNARSVLVPAGFQVGAPPAGGGDQVIFETQRNLWATAAQLLAIAVDSGGLRLPISVGPTGVSPFPPLGSNPKAGDALWIGLAGQAEPYPRLSLGLTVSSVRVPAPVAAGGPASDPAGVAPLLRWELLDGDTFRAVDVIIDQTAGLTTSGVIELGLPGGWGPAAPGSSPAAGLRWLRVTLTHGGYPVAPVLTAVRVNMVAAHAVRTLRNDPLEPVQGSSPDGRTRLRLAHTPVLPGTVRLRVEDDTGTDIFGTAPQQSTRWVEVPSLAGRSPDDRVFTLDPQTGVLTFGDGLQGRRVPPGFRNVTAESYQVGGGTAGRVQAGAITALVSSLPFVVGVTNPDPATGGSDPEPVPATLRRGAGRLRARDRAVAAADYGLLALQTPGALVARAAGIAGLDPQRPGIPEPGVVGVLVVPPPAADPSGGPPVPGSPTLQAVASHLSTSVAPLGVRVVAAAPDYHAVRVEGWVVLAADADTSQVLRAATDALVGYLHPLTGGNDGAGWPFGGPLRNVTLLRRLLAVPGVGAVSELTLVVDGVRLPPCSDRWLPPGALLWPERPLLVPVPATTVVGTP